MQYEIVISKYYLLRFVNLSTNWNANVWYCPFWKWLKTFLQSPRNLDSLWSGWGGGGGRLKKLYSADTFPNQGHIKNFIFEITVPLQFINLIWFVKYYKNSNVKLSV